MNTTPGLTFDFATLKRIALRGDLTSSYMLAVVRVIVWAVLAAWVYRVGGTSALAIFTIARTVVTITSYLGLGLAPAVVVLLPQMQVTLAPKPAEPDVTTLNYQPRPNRPRAASPIRLFGTASLLAYVPLFVVMFIVVGLALFNGLRYGDRFYDRVVATSLLFAVGTAVRPLGDVAGARLAVGHRMALDNKLLLAGEMLWLIMALSFAPRVESYSNQWGIEACLQCVAVTYVISSLITTVARIAVDQRFADEGPEEQIPANAVRAFTRFHAPSAKLLLATGGAVLFSQLADLLYGPASLWVMGSFLSRTAVGIYSPTLHLDAGLLLLIAGPAAVLLPRAAQLRAAGDVARLRRDYLIGTLGSFVLLLTAALVLWAISAPLFRVWFGDDLPATRAILPWVLLHTVLGGTAAVGRSVLIGIGRVKAYTTAALIGGVANVTLAILFVTQLHWGLWGVVFATILTVGVRCAIWMPWFTLRAIRDLRPPSADEPPLIAAATPEISSP